MLAEAIKSRQSEVPDVVVVTDESGTEVYSLPLVAMLPKNLRGS
jgi:hypothetical protein